MEMTPSPLVPPRILPKDLWNSGILREPPEINTDREDNCCFNPQYPASPRTYLDEAGIVALHIAKPHDRIIDLPSEIDQPDIRAPLARRSRCDAIYLQSLVDADHGRCLVTGIGLGSQFH